ncbi:MAG: serine hydrolase [Alphaproteobacteria bacterium]|nr:serine hydrolase [Alphaproteobacteria bacterium]
MRPLQKRCDQVFAFAARCTKVPPQSSAKQRGLFMKFIGASLLCLGLALPGAAVAATVAAAPTEGVERAPLPELETESRHIEAVVDGVIPTLLTARHVPGAVIAVVRRDGTLLVKGYGLADIGTGTPVDANDTLFRVASVSKLITATAVMQMVELGRLVLDADVERYVPDIELWPRQSSPVTVRQLLTHTPGFDDRFVRGIAPLGALDIPLRIYLADNIPPRVMPSGSLISYSNHGYALLGRLVEAASGEELRSYFAGRIFRPLGMSRSRFGVPLPVPSTMATPYKEDAQGVLRARSFDQWYMWPAAELVTTGADMSRFMLSMLNDGKGLMHPQTAQQMMATQMRNAPDLPGWTFGFKERLRDGYRAIGHDGSLAGFGAELMLIPEVGAGYFVATNKDFDPVFFRAVEDAMFAEFAPPKEDASLAALDAGSQANAERVAGSYHPNRNVRFDFMRLGRLIQEAHLVAGVGGSLILDRPRSAGGALTFLPTAPGLWTNAREQISLRVLGDPGEADRISIGPWVYDRTTWFEQAGVQYSYVMLTAFLGVLCVLVWGVHGPLMRMLGEAHITVYPTELRVLGIFTGGLVMTFLLGTLVLLSTTDPFEIIVAPPSLLYGLAWFPVILALITVPLGVLVYRTATADGVDRPLARAASALPLLAALMTIYFALLWNLTPWGL